MKRNWKDHPVVGLMIGVNMADGPVICKIVDAKAGPMTINTSAAAMAQPDADVRGTIILRVKLPGGAEQWLPPMDGESICAWADRQRVELVKEQQP